MKTIKRAIGGKEYNVKSGLAREVRGADDGLGSYSNTYVQINLDKDTGEIWGDFHCSIGRNSWTEYHEDNIVSLGMYADNKFQLEDLAEALSEV